MVFAVHCYSVLYGSSMSLPVQTHSRGCLSRSLPSPTVVPFPIRCRCCHFLSRPGPIDALARLCRFSDGEDDYYVANYYCRRGYAEAEIEAVFSKYDINGDRALDDVELRQMAADLEGQKVN